MGRQIGAFKERIVGWLLVLGLVVTVVSAFLTWMFSVSGVYRGTFTREPVTNRIRDVGTLNLVPLTITCFSIGLLMMIAGIAYGLMETARKNSGIRRTLPNFRILARYCYDRNQQLITSDWDVEVADRPRFYVKAMLETGVVGEFETSQEVYFQAGEGMSGEAELQGQWLGRFVPYIGATPANPSQ